MRYNETPTPEEYADAYDEMVQNGMIDEEAINGYENEEGWEEVEETDWSGEIDYFGF